jgi:hypothetical protein
MLDFLKRRKLRKATQAALRDGMLDASEKKQLVGMANELRVGTRAIDEVRHADFLKRVQPIIKRVNQLQRMTNNDLSEIYSIADKLGVEPDINQNLEMCWLLNAWEQSEDEPPPNVSSDAILSKGEVCHFCQKSEWLKHKVVKQRVGYSGFSASIKIVKGVRYRVGNVRPVYKEHSQLESQAGGTLHVTKKRLMFDGEGRSTSIQLNKIVGVQGFSDGIEVSKASGKDDYFKLIPLHSEFVQALIARLIN